jgi:pantothenate synthetase
MILGEKLTHDNLHIFSDPKGEVWVCNSCGEVLSPEEAQNNYDIQRKFKKAYHYCRNGEKHELRKRTVDEILSRYKYTFYDYSEVTNETKVGLDR